MMYEKDHIHHRKSFALCNHVMPSKRKLACAKEDFSLFLLWQLKKAVALRARGRIKHVDASSYLHEDDSITNKQSLAGCVERERL